MGIFYLSIKSKKMKRLSLLSLIVLTTWIYSCQPGSTEEDVEQIIFENVNVIPMTSEIVLEGQSVVIRGGKIYRIAAAADVTGGSKSTVIEGKGKYLVPGISEMHAHIPQPGPGRDRVRETLLLYLSNGITTIRGMLGHPSHLELKKDVLSGTVLGPTIYTSSPSMNGNSIPTKEKADSSVRAHQAAGYDFLKVHPGIKLDVFNVMVATANEVGIGYSGHVPFKVGIKRAIESKFGSVDHVDGFIEGIVPDDQRLSEAENGFFGFNSAQIGDEGMISYLVNMTVEHKVWVVPTQSLFDRWASPEDSEILGAQPEMKYMPKSQVETWKNNKKDFLSQDYFSVKKYEKFNGLRKKIIKALNENGHGLLLGSDAPQVFNVPGFSIQHEMKGMADAGLSAFDVIKSGTVNVAKFFGKEGEFGVVREGATADLILLNANPLDDISNMKEIDGVMVRGQWLDRQFLDSELGKIATKYAADK